MWNILKPLDSLDNLIPSVRLLIPLPLDAAQANLRENLDLFFEKFRMTERKEMKLDKVNENTVSFRLRLNSLNINGLLSYETDTTSLIECKFKTSRRHKAAWILVYSLANPLIFCGACGIFSKEIKEIFWWGLILGPILALMGLLSWVFRFVGDTRFMRRKLINSLQYNTLD